MSAAPFSAMYAQPSQPLGQEEQEISNELSHCCGLAMEDIAQLRHGDASTSRVAQMQCEARVQDKFKRIRYLLHELKIAAEEQDT